MCKERIEKAALSVSGISFANWEAETKMFQLNYSNGISILENHYAVALTGHDTECESPLIPFMTNYQYNVYIRD